MHATLTYSELLLDLRGDAILPAGYSAINTEVAWLEIASALADSTTTPPPVLLRGEGLCQWAKVWWEARGGAVKWCESPSKHLQDTYKGLSINQAQQLLQELPTTAQLKVPAPVALLALLYPATTVWITLPAYPSPKALQEHVANWLLWVAEQPAEWPAHHLPVVESVVSSWRSSHSAAAPLWLVNRAEADTAVRQWLKITPVTTTEMQPALAATLEWAGSFPVPLTNFWRVQTNAALITSLPELPSNPIAAAEVVSEWWTQQIHRRLSTPVRRIAAVALADFISANPLAASLPLLKQLEGELPAATIDALRPLVPPPLPPPLPNTPPDVLAWVTQAYLPYRQWQVTNNQAVASNYVSAAAREFGEWLLQVYPTKLLDAAYPYQQLYWAKKANHPAPNEVIIWVIADGLGWGDAQNLLRLVTQSSVDKPNGQLAAISATPCFGLLPTITSHTKEPLRRGVPLSHLAGVESAATTDLKSNDNLTQAALNAKPGDLLVWRPYDPDPIYHKHVHAEVARQLVQGALVTLAIRIADAANAVPSGPTVRVLITTDHGRLLSDSPRTLLAPAGCQVEGRTSHLPKEAPVQRPASDTNDVRWLDPQLFCLPNWAGVAIGESAFRIPVGETTHGGSAPFPHGGVWPEEVVLPWLELVRDAGPVTLTAILTGAGRAGFPGSAQLRLRNESRHTVRVIQFDATFGTNKPLIVPLHQTSIGLQTSEITVNLPNWPNSAQVQSGIMNVLVETAEGRQLAFLVESELENTALQDRGLDIGAEFGL